MPPKEATEQAAVKPRSWQIKPKARRMGLAQFIESTPTEDFAVIPPNLRYAHDAVGLLNKEEHERYLLLLQTYESYRASLVADEKNPASLVTLTGSLFACSLDAELGIGPVGHSDHRLLQDCSTYLAGECANHKFGFYIRNSPCVMINPRVKQNRDLPCASFINSLVMGDGAPLSKNGPANLMLTVYDVIYKEPHLNAKEKDQENERVFSALRAHLRTNTYQAHEQIKSFQCGSPLLQQEVRLVIGKLENDLDLLSRARSFPDLAGFLFIGQAFQANSGLPRSQMLLRADLQKISRRACVQARLDANATTLDEASKSRLAGILLLAREGYSPNLESKRRLQEEKRG